MAWYVVVTLAPRQILGMGCLLFMVAAHGESLRDPTQPEGWGAAPVIENPTTRPVVEVNSIVYSGSRRHAMVNGVLLEAGQKVEGIELVKVERDQVMLKWQGQTWKQGVSQSLTIRR